MTNIVFDGTFTYDLVVFHDQTRTDTLLTRMGNCRRQKPGLDI